MVELKRGSASDLMNGAALQCIEAATLGMPFEVWKTRMGRFRTESTGTAFVNIYRRGGITEYWRGLGPKLIESASKGAVLLYSKEMLMNFCEYSGFGGTSSGFIAGAGAGVCQTVVMGPCTFLVTCVVTGNNEMPILKKMKSTWTQNGLKGFYPGGTAIAMRQATNWASRQGLTEYARKNLKKRKLKNIDGVNENGITEKNIKECQLTVKEEALAGIMGGAFSTWNQPFEVARIHMQAAANEGKSKQNMLKVLNQIVRTEGPTALFTGIVPRIGLGVWQTLFMVTGAKLIRKHLFNENT